MRSMLMLLGLLCGAAPSTAIAGPPRAAPMAQAPHPEVGDEAPDFILRERGSEEVVTLSSFEGKRPVALVFGSYT